MNNDHFIAFFSMGSRKPKFQFFTLYSLWVHGSHKGLMSNVNSLFWTSRIGLSKTHSFILYECLVRKESMTKNDDFGQNRQNVQYASRLGQKRSDCHSGTARANAIFRIYLNLKWSRIGSRFWNKSIKTINRS